MRLITKEQSQLLDLACESRNGLSSKMLIERAARVAFETLKKTQDLKRPVKILCGPGNNGKDGRELAQLLGAQMYDENSFLKFTPEKGDLIIDALFGVGLNRALEGEYLRIVQLINLSQALVISLDVPSGLDANTGCELGLSVRASETYSFGLNKPGFYLNQGPELCGKIRLLDIHYPKELVSEIAATHFLIKKKQVQTWLPFKKETAHKSHSGRALILAGSAGFEGAATLSAKAASRCGAGYVYVSGKSKIPDFIRVDLKNKPWFKKEISSLAVGPGLGVDNKTKTLLRDLVRTFSTEKSSGKKNSLKRTDTPVILDADALTVLAKMKIKLPPRWVLTPHAGEMSRLIGKEATWVEQNRFEALRLAHAKYGCVVLLKGFHTVVFDGVCFFIISSGNKALAKAGTGDVLTGMIAGFAAQGVGPIKSAILASFLHGYMADLWVKSGRDYLSLMASDLIDQLPKLMARLRK